MGVIISKKVTIQIWPSIKAELAFFFQHLLSTKLKPLLWIRSVYQRIFINNFSVSVQRTDSIIDAVGLNCQVTMQFLGIFIKKLAEKLKIVKQGRKLWKPFKIFLNNMQQGKCKDTLNIEHVCLLTIFPKNVKLQSQPLKTLLVLIKHDTHMILQLN